MRTIGRRPLALAACSLLAAFCLAPQTAHAHLVQTGFGTFYDGLVHLFITPPDLLVAIGLGLLAGLCGAAASRGVVFALPAAWLAGEMAGAFFPASLTLPWLTTVSFGAVGVLVAMNTKLPRALLVTLACGVGLLHGFVNGTTMAAAGTDRLGMIGASVSVFLVITLASALVVSLRAHWAQVAVRVAGSWIAAIGLLMLGWLVRGLG